MCQQKAKDGALLINEAILELLNKESGLRNCEIARKLGLKSESPDGSQKGWLCYGFLQNLLCKREIKKIDKKYYINDE